MAQRFRARKSYTEFTEVGAQRAQRERRARRAERQWPMYNPCEFSGGFHATRFCLRAIRTDICGGCFWASYAEGVIAGAFKARPYAGDCRSGDVEGGGEDAGRRRSA